jgi:hypothetical protein
VSVDWCKESYFTPWGGGSSFFRSIWQNPLTELLWTNLKYTIGRWTSCSWVWRIDEKHEFGCRCLYSALQLLFTTYPWTYMKCSPGVSLYKWCLTKVWKVTRYWIFFTYLPLSHKTVSWTVAIDTHKATHNKSRISSMCTLTKGKVFVETFRITDTKCRL